MPNAARIAVQIHPRKTTNNGLTLRDSEQVGFLHDAEEFFLVHFAVAVTISFVDHLLKLFVGHALAEFLGDTLQVLERDLSSFVVIEQTESFKDLVLRVPVQNLM